MYSFSRCLTHLFPLRSGQKHELERNLALSQGRYMSYFTLTNFLDLIVICTCHSYRVERPAHVLNYQNEFLCIFALFISGISYLFYCTNSAGIFCPSPFLPDCAITGCLVCRSVRSRVQSPDGDVGVGASQHSAPAFHNAHTFSLTERECPPPHC